MNREERRKSILADIVGNQVNSLIVPTVIAVTIIVVVILIWHFAKREG